MPGNTAKRGGRLFRYRVGMGPTGWQDAAEELDRRRLLINGLRGRCPICAQNKLFRAFEIVEDCPRCDLHFERVEGHWIGSVGINTIVSFGLLLVVLATGFILTAPDIAVGPLIAIGVATAVVFPILFHRVSKTLWTAIDLAMRPLEIGEVAPGWELEASRQRR